jgi:hypothetical protein
MRLQANIEMTHPALLRALAEDIERNGHAVLEQRPKERPLIGDNWPSQGGRLVGIVRDGDEERAVIVCTDKAGQFVGEWGNYGTEIPKAKDDHDGLRNTKAMAEAGSDLAKKVLALDLEGFKDWYIPARQELVLCYMHAKNVFDEEWYWSSTQFSSYYAWLQGFDSGYVTTCTKVHELRVRAVRTILL